MISFSSENYSGAHPDFIRAIERANVGNASSYGRDDFTSRAQQLIRDEFSADCDVFFAFNGTGANNFGLAAISKPYNSIFCTDVSHLYVDESTAPEALIGCRIYAVKSEHGKIDIDDLEDKIKRFGDIHHPQPAILTISQPTEYGTVYTSEEIKLLSSLLRQHNMRLHVDGARFFNAAVSLNLPFKEMVQGVDVLTLGGTKNGMLFGEAVLFFGESRNENIGFHLKRSMQLASKMRFISAQFEAMLQHNLWYKLAAHANNMASYFQNEILQNTKLKITRPVQTNAVFIEIEPAYSAKLQQFASFYIWNEYHNEARFMFSFDNTTDEIDLFIEHLRLLKL